MTKNVSTIVLTSPIGLSSAAVIQISVALRQLLADVFGLYLKTKNFHWHMTGRHFRDYHLLLDEQAAQIFAMTDEIAERARKIGGHTLRSIGDISRRKRLMDNDEGNLRPEAMLTELRDDNSRLTGFLRETHELCAKHNDFASTSFLEVWIDQSERRTWFLNEIVNESDRPRLRLVGRNSGAQAKGLLPSARPAVPYAESPLKSPPYPRDASIRGVRAEEP